jgi:hypothetical protein
MTVAVILCHLDQLLDLVLGQVLSGADVAILGPAGSDCSILVVSATRCMRGLVMRNPPLACLTVQYISIL